MQKQIISKKAVQDVLRCYIAQFRLHPWFAGIAFIAPSLGNVLVFFVPPLMVAELINLYLAQSRVVVGESIILIGVAGGSWLLGEMLWRIGHLSLTRVAADGIGNLTKIAYKRLVFCDYDFFANNFVGSLTKKALAFSRGFELFTDTLIFNVTGNVLSVLFTLVILWRYSFVIPVTLLLCIALVILIAVPIIKKRSRLVTLRHEASSRIAGRLSDSLTNILAIKSFSKEVSEHAVYSQYADEYSVRNKRAGDYQTLHLDMLISPLYVITNVIGLFLAIFFVSRLALEPGAIIVIFAYYGNVTRFFWEVNRIYRNLESAVSEAAEFTELFTVATRIENDPKAALLKVERGEVRFADVRFSYVEETKEVAAFLKGFNLTIRSQEKVGLVGPSGGGKTTITKLILRFIDISDGIISIDGQDIRRVTQTSLRENISYVPQEPLLFHRSLFENIAYGNPDAEETDVIKASKLAHAHDFIMELPNAYRTLVGERGVKLSGGQRQRVAIARAILKNSPLLVLDEATSSLDSESEKYIQEGLIELMKDKTALVIAHRLSTIKHLDRIIVLDNGKIIEEGSHDDLLEKRGLYAKLWSHQSGEFL